jgi:acetolactate synthase-1/3 small subunit
MGARIVDMSRNLMMIEMCDTPERVSIFLDTLKSVSIVEITRTGVLAMTKCGEHGA